MRVVGVSRVLDEADVIEPFIRHHAALLDLHIVLDNGSSDGTVEILRRLHDEGLALQVYRTAAPIFLEQAYNTALYRFALQEGADWVVYLDADELLVVDAGARPAEVLALVPDGIVALRLPAYRYQRPDDQPDLVTHPFLNLRRRAQVAEMAKVAVRRVDPARIAVYAGNHFVFLDGREEPGMPQDRLWLAHVPDRSPLQVARKVILARMKAIASGTAAAAHFSVHRMADMVALQEDARAWLDQPIPPAPVDDPVTYRGGALRYTAAPDDLARTISLFAASMEQLARSHGDILDAKRLIRQDVVKRAQQLERLF